MTRLDNIFHYLSKRQYEFQMAWGVFGQAFTIITFETFAMVFTDKFGITGYPALFLYAVVPVAGIIGVTYTGHKMVTTGYATKYANYGSNVNSDWVELTNNVKAIRNQLDEVQERK